MGFWKIFIRLFQINGEDIKIEQEEAEAGKKRKEDRGLFQEGIEGGVKRGKTNCLGSRKNIRRL